MLRPTQIVVCTALALAFWIVATGAIRTMPALFTTEPAGSLGFLTGIPVGWLCVRLVCRVAGLAPDQILPGCVVVLGTAMLIDGVALRWFHAVYGGDEHVFRFGAAWLLWGYGTASAAALLVAHNRTRALRHLT